MEYNKEQRKIINSKPHRHMLIKGKKSTGKTTAIINKIPSLLNNYCIDKDDKILVAARNEKHSNLISFIYDNIESEKYHQSSFFDTDNSDKLEIRTIDALMLYYFNEYKNHNKSAITVASNEECEKQLTNAINVVRNKYEKQRFNIADTKYIQFIQDEIMWIKSCGFLNLNEYQSANRIGRLNILSGDTKILRKNSKQRQAIYEILIEYNKNMSKLSKIDDKDMAIMALESARKSHIKKYTHILIDECENLTKVEIEFLKALYNDKAYSSITFIINTDSSINQNAWLIKGRSFASLGYDMKGKSITLKTQFIKKVSEIKVNMDVLVNNGKQNKDLNNNSFELDAIEFIDLKRNVSHKFIKDSGNLDDIYIEDNGVEEKVEEVLNIPLFNEIAAGSPILMNDAIEDNYYLPKDWVRNPKDVFMLKVKGDSMIKKNIYDGDYVLISKQNVPSIKDIVAVDIEGEATLKTYKVIDGKITLTPENDKYDPIIIEDQQFCFLGVAIGIIKNS